MAHERTLRANVPMRQLVRRLSPETLEPWPSYIDRLADFWKVPLSVMLSRLGLVESDGKKSFPAYGVFLTEAQATGCALVAGLARDEIDSMLLARLAPQFMPDLAKDGLDSKVVSETARQGWVYFNGTHLCPACLRERSGAWSLLWKLPWSFACVKHQVILVDRCPDCGRRPRAGYQDNRLSPPFYGKIPRPLLCNNVLPTGIARHGQASAGCCCDLSRLAALPADAEVLEAQAFLDAELQSAIGGRSAEGKQFFDEMRSICALALYCAEAEDFPLLSASAAPALREHAAHRDAAQGHRSDMIDGRMGPRLRAFIGVPRNARLMAAICQIALPVVRATNEAEVFERVLPLADRLRQRSPKFCWAALEYFRFSDRLRRSLAKCLSERGTFDRRVGALSEASAKAQHTYLPSNVPQLLPLQIYLDHFEHIFPRIRDDVARKVCSMAAVKLLGYTWAEAGRFLGLPESADRQANHVVTQLNRDGTYVQFAEALHKWAGSIDRSFDFEQLRSAFVDFTDYEYDSWCALCVRAGVGPGKKGGRSKYAAAWIWANITGGDWALAPAFSGVVKPNQREVYRVLSKTVFLPMRKLLSEAGEKMLVGKTESLYPSAGD